MSYHSLFVHLVWSTKYREPLMQPALQIEMYPYVSSLVNMQKAQIVIVNGIEDHIHLLVRLPTHLSVADCVRVVKSNSARWANERLGRRSTPFWQEKFSAFSVNPKEAHVVKAYIANQKRHHGVEGYQAEIRRALDEHEIEYDERYVWD